MPDAAVLPLPLTIEDIDTAWLTSTLSDSFPGIEVEDFEVVSVRHGFTTVVRVRLQVNDAGRAAGVPETVIVKGGFEPWSRDRARTYAMEAIAYRDLWPYIQLNVPRAYFSDVDEERKQAIVVMEDLVPRGVSFGAGLETRTYEQVARSLSSLAAFHAQTWNSPELQPGGRWGTTSLFEPDGKWSGISGNGALIMRDYLYQVGYFQEDAVERLRMLPRGAAQAFEFQELEWAKLAFDYISALGDVLPTCVVHGDTHLGNVYEEADGTPGWFDPVPHKEPPHMELAYHITCALDPSDRKRWDRALVAHYLSELERRGIQPPDFDETMRHVAAYMTYGFWVFFINDVSWQTETFNTAHAVRFSAAMIDHGVHDMILDGAREPTMAKAIAALHEPPPFRPSKSRDWLWELTAAGDPHLAES